MVGQELSSTLGLDIDIVSLLCIKQFTSCMKFVSINVVNLYSAG
jgi:hypothetical protein